MINLKLILRNVNIIIILFGFILLVKYILVGKSSFFDDSYIYAHIASNFIETYSFKFFPLEASENYALLSSSPMRLFLLLPAEFLTHFFNIDRTEIGFRISLILYFVTVSFFMFYILNKKCNFFIPFIFSLFLSLCFETVLQMEGLLLFWWFFSFFFFLYNEKLDSFKISVFTVLLALIRIDVLVAILPLIIFEFFKLENKDKIKTISYLIIFSVGYFIFMFLAGVYPIPTTFYSKILTMKLNLSNGVYFDVFFTRVKDYFNNQLALTIILYLSSILFVISFIMLKYKRYTIYILILFIGLLLIDANKPSWFLWYFENFLVINLAIFLITIMIYIDKFNPKNVKILYISPLIIFCTLSVYFNMNNNRNLPWNTKGPFFNGYSHLKDYYNGEGLFDFPNLPKGYAVISEIGIASYFGGNNFLLGDRLGLIQPGFFEKVITSKLRVLYPDSVLRSIEDDFKDKSQPIYMIWAGVDNGQYCSSFIKNYNLCIQKIDDLNVFAQSLKKE